MLLKMWCSALAALSLMGCAHPAPTLALSHSKPAPEAHKVPVFTAAVMPVSLRCEYRADPLGIDSARPRVGWLLQAGSPAARGLTQTAYRVLAASSPAKLGAGQGDLWDSGKVASGRLNQIAYAGKPLRSGQAVWWKVQAWNQAGRPSGWSRPAQWTMGVLSQADWQGAQWIGAPDANAAQSGNGPKAKYETVLLRRGFTVKPHLTRALAFVCGLGQYEMTVNGAKVGDALLTPGWTKYDKTCLYDTYDITSALRPGANAVGLFLGNGFYNIHSGRYTKITGTFGPLQAIGLIRLEYADGSVQNVATNDQWKSASGPITFSSIYGGEDYDARLVPAGWDRPDFADAAWDAPAVTKGPGGVLQGLSAAGPPIRSMGVLVPVGQKQINPTTTVYDLGQNASLMVKIVVHGPAGSSVKVTPSELVNASGDINDTMCGGDSYWTYNLSGQGDESYFSKFYYRGGRYLKVELSPATPGGALPALKSIQGVVIRADAPSVGQFACANDIYNKIFNLVRWAQKNNMLSVMTDCPTREKLGWLEEDHLNGPALRYNFDLATLMGKMAGDMADSQRDNGLVPSTCPDIPRWGEGKYTNPVEWGSACLMVPWQQYQFDGDIGLLRERYDTMKRYMAYLDARAHDHIIDFGLGDWYDNHSEGEPTLTPVGLTDTAFYFNDYVVLTQMAAALGKDDDAADFAQKAAQIKQAFNVKFYNPATGDYAQGAQGSNCLPLAMDIVDPANRPTVFAHLVSDLKQKGTTAGEVSFEYLLKALADGGRSDLIYTTYGTTSQGYGLQVKQGKTSLTEGWNGGASQDHFMFGQINEWLYRSLVGIQPDPDGPGFTKIIFRPALVGDLTHAEATYDSLQGRVASSWTHTPSGLTLKVTVPIGATATVYVPAVSAQGVKEGGHPASSAPGVTFLRAEPDVAVYAVGSGSYAFTSAPPVALTPPAAPAPVANVGSSLVADSGFETVAVDGFAYAPDGSAWTFSPQSGFNGAGLTGNGSGFTSTNPQPIPEGNQAAFLQGHGVISQTLIGLRPGTAYTLTFAAAQRVSSSHGGETWQVRLDDKVIGEYAPPASATAYTDYTAKFIAAAPRQTLAFAGTAANGDDNTVFIDNVRLRIGK